MSVRQAPIGYTRPFTPRGHASGVTPFPWNFGGDLLLIHFRTDPNALSALLPPPLEPADNSGEAFLWSPHLHCYPDAIEAAALHPSRTHYNVAVIGIPCLLAGKRTMFSAFQWGDRDWLVMMSWFLGACSKIATIDQSGIHSMIPGRQNGSWGTFIRRTVSRHGETLIDMSFIPSREVTSKDVEFYTRHLPLTCMRHFPDCEIPPRGHPAVHDLVQMVMTDTRVGTITAGNATLRFCEADNEELLPIQPHEVLGGYMLPMGFVLRGVTVVHNYLSPFEGKL